MNTNGAVPGLAVILVGERPDSEKYVSMKKKLAEKVHTETARQGDTWWVTPRSYMEFLLVLSCVVVVVLDLLQPRC